MQKPLRGFGVTAAQHGKAGFREWIAERVEPWSDLKFPSLKKVGCQGFRDGADSGIYMATPLARLNVADTMTTPLAQAEYERFFATRGKPAHSRLAIHWARLIELLYAAERWLELALDADITSPDVRVLAQTEPGEDVGVVEAPRGTLTHHYRADARGLLIMVNLVVGTTTNNAAMSLSIAKAAKALIKPGLDIAEGLLNRIDMAYRAYDP